MKHATIIKKQINGENCFVKKYEDSTSLPKLMNIFDQLNGIQFPYIEPISKYKHNAFKQKWLTGYHHADFAKSTDRQQTWTALNELHKTNKLVRWKTIKELPPITLQQKWQDRMRKFYAKEKAIKEILGDEFELIRSLAEQSFHQIEWGKPSKRTICHGDVAHHNFLVNNEDIKIIDLDLAYLGCAEDEMILWVMRVLPFMDYDLAKLLKELPELMHLKHKFHYLLFPNELMRETLYFIKLTPIQRKNFGHFYQEFVENAMKNREKLQQQIKSCCIGVNTNL